MKTLNSQQLAFLLDIKKEDARIRMCNAWEKAHNIPKSWIGELKVKRDAKNKIKDPYPNDMLIELLATGLNLPSLQQMVDDIEQNYLKRNATKRWILCDYPETELKKKAEKGSLLTLNIPPVLLSMLPQETIDTIRGEWIKRFPVALVK